MNKPRMKKCKMCDNRFVQISSTHVCCSFVCAIKKAKIDNEKKQKKIDRQKKTELKTRSEHIKELQAIFNKFIRIRDKGKPCICCGKPMSEDKYGGSVDAGHYRSVGSAPHLRFNENNVHAQRKHCNSYGSGNAVDYRLGLIARIGIEEVEKLEADQKERQYSIEELVKMKAEYRAKIKALEKS